MWVALIIIVPNVSFIPDEICIVDVVLFLRRLSSAHSVARALPCSARAFAVVFIVYIEMV
jgi:hypothetical protein